MRASLRKKFRGRRASFLFFAMIAAACITQSGCVPASYETSADVQDTNDDVHYLAAYGTWQAVAPYGIVWCPNVVADWQPFSYGHWTWSYDGWAWVSYEPFGWLVYHYGNWYYSQDIGWFWVPGDTWSPAQVEWYSFGDYCAWAPLPPGSVSWPEPWETNGLNIWVLINVSHFTDENIGRERVQRPVSREIMERQGIVKQAPEIGHVQRLEKRTIQPVRIERRPADIRRQTPPGPSIESRQVEPRVRPVEVRPQTPEGQPAEIRPQTPEAQRTATRPQAATGQPESVRASNSKLERMVLPQVDKRKVQRYQPQVTREVLVPKRPAQSARQEKGSEADTTKKKDTVNR
jgi:hypothetical protein